MAFIRNVSIVRTVAVVLCFEDAAT